MEEKESTKSGKEGGKKKLSKALKNVFLLGLWMAVICKKDISNLVTSKFPTFSLWKEYIKNYGIFIGLGIAVILILRWRFFLRWALLFILFPIKLFLWLIPKYTYKALRSLYIVPRSAYKLTLSVRVNLIILIVFILSTVAILRQWYIPLYLCYIVMLNIVLLFIYGHLMTLVVSPAFIYHKVTNLAEKLWTGYRKKFTKILSDLQNHPENKDKLEKRRDQHIKSIEAYEKAGSAFCELLEKVNNRTVIVQIFLISCVLYLFLVIFSFSLQYHSLLMRYPDSISGIEENSITNCLYFSFTHMFGTNYGGSIPLSKVAKLTSSLQTVYALAIGVVLFIIFTTVTVQRYEQDLSSIIRIIRNIVNEMRELRSPRSQALELPIVDAEITDGGDAV